MYQPELIQFIAPFKDLTKPLTPLTGRHGLGVSMTASISRGRVLSKEEWDVVERAIAVAFQLRDAREKVGLPFRREGQAG